MTRSPASGKTNVLPGGRFVGCQLRLTPLLISIISIAAGLADLLAANIKLLVRTG